MYNMCTCTLGPTCTCTCTRKHHNRKFIFYHKLGSSPHAQVFCMCTSVVVYEYQHTCMYMHVYNHKTNECSRYMYRYMYVCLYRSELHTELVHVPIHYVGSIGDMLNLTT